MITSAEIASSVEAVPALSHTVVRLAGLLQDPASTTQDFERVIIQDPALTANLLKLANSPYYSRARSIGTVRDACLVLGTRTLFEVVTGADLHRIAPDVLPGYGGMSGGFWAHSVATAVLAETLATKAGVKPPPMMFTAGLLHDIGKLALATFVAAQQDSFSASLDEVGTCINDAEISVLGFGHDEVGLAVAEAWQLPIAIAQVCRWHHAPSEAPDPVDPVMLDLVHIADGVSHMIGYGDDIAGLARPLDTAAVKRMGIKRRVLESALVEVQDLVESLLDSLNDNNGGE